MTREVVDHMVASVSCDLVTKHVSRHKEELRG